MSQNYRAFLRFTEELEFQEKSIDCISSAALAIGRSKLNRTKADIFQRHRVLRIAISDFYQKTIVVSGKREMNFIVSLQNQLRRAMKVWLRRKHFLSKMNYRFSQSELHESGYSISLTLKAWHLKTLEKRNRDRHPLLRAKWALQRLLREKNLSKYRSMYCQLASSYYSMRAVTNLFFIFLKWGRQKSHNKFSFGRKVAHFIGRKALLKWQLWTRKLNRDRIAAADFVDALECSVRRSRRLVNCLRSWNLTYRTRRSFRRFKSGPTRLQSWLLRKMRICGLRVMRLFHRNQIMFSGAYKSAIMFWRKRLMGTTIGLLLSSINQKRRISSSQCYFRATAIRRALKILQLYKSSSLLSKRAKLACQTHLTGTYWARFKAMHTVAHRRSQRRALFICPLQAANYHRGIILWAGRRVWYAFLMRRMHLRLLNERARAIRRGRLLACCFEALRTELIEASKPRIAALIAGQRYRLRVALTRIRALCFRAGRYDSARSYFSQTEVVRGFLTAWKLWARCTRRSRRHFKVGLRLSQLKGRSVGWSCLMDDVAARMYYKARSRDAAHIFQRRRLLGVFTALMKIVMEKRAARRDASSFAAAARKQAELLAIRQYAPRYYEMRLFRWGVEQLYQSCVRSRSEEERIYKAEQDMFALYLIKSMGIWWAWARVSSVFRKSKNVVDRHYREQVLRRMFRRYIRRIRRKVVAKSASRRKRRTMAMIAMAMWKENAPPIPPRIKFSKHQVVKNKSAAGKSSHQSYHPPSLSRGFNFPGKKKRALPSLTEHTRMHRSPAPFPVELPILSFDGDFRKSRQRTTCLYAGQRLLRRGAEKGFSSLRVLAAQRKRTRRLAAIRNEKLVAESVDKWSAFVQAVQGYTNHLKSFTNVLRPFRLRRSFLKIRRVARILGAYQRVERMRMRTLFTLVKKITRHNNRIRSCIKTMLRSSGYRELKLSFQEWCVFTDAEATADAFIKRRRQMRKAQAMSLWRVRRLRHVRLTKATNAAREHHLFFSRWSVFERFLAFLGKKYDTLDVQKAAYAHYLNFCRKSVLSNLLFYRRNRIAEKHQLSKFFHFFISQCYARILQLRSFKLLCAKGTRMLLTTAFRHIRDGIERTKATQGHRTTIDERKKRSVEVGHEICQTVMRRSLTLLLTWTRHRLRAKRKLVKSSNWRLFYLKSVYVALMSHFARLRRKQRSICLALSLAVRGLGALKAIQALDMHSTTSWAGRVRIGLMMDFSRRLFLRRGLTSLRRSISGRLTHTRKHTEDILIHNLSSFY